MEGKQEGWGQGQGWVNWVHKLGVGLLKYELEASV